MALFPVVAAAVIVTTALVLVASLPLAPGYGALLPYRTAALAANFLQYRNAVIEYVEQNPGFAGSVSTTTLVNGGLLPSGYRAIGNWTNQTASGQTVVYGSMPMDGVASVLEQSDGDYSIGINNAGRLFSPLYGDTGITVPAYVPNNWAVSIVQTG